MKFYVLAAGAAVLAAPAAAQITAQKPEPPKVVMKGESSGKPAVVKKAGDEFDMTLVMGFFDKMFPPQPDPAPERLAMARTTAAAVVPNGTYAGMFGDAMSGLVERVLSINPNEFAPKAKATKADSLTLRQQLAKDDPHFEERMKIAQRVIGEELLKIAAVVEPKLREGLARAIARRFDQRQLQEINAFLATDSGRAFAGQSMRMWVDPDVMRSMMQSMPEMLTAMPGAMKRLEAATAHLPKPKKKAGDAAPPTKIVPVPKETDVEEPEA